MTKPTINPTLPTVGAAEDTWGTTLNNNFTLIEEAFNGETAGGVPVQIAPDLAKDYWKINNTAVTATADELNILDGVTATTDEINYLDGVTSNVQTQLNSISMSDAYPVGSIYMNATNATNPATLLGFGTWVAFGAGRMPVGFDAADGLFNSPEETGGSKDATLVSHSHTFSGTTSGVGDHTHTYGRTHTVNTDGGYEGSPGQGSPAHATWNTGGAGAHSHTYSGTTSGSGTSGTNANLPPYITVYMWKRTA